MGYTFLKFTVEYAHHYKKNGLKTPFKMPKLFKLKIIEIVLESLLQKHFMA